MKLKTNPDNPRTISKDKYDKLKRSIERNPDGLTANKIGYKDDIIISGNQRYRAIVELGLEHKPEWFKDLSGWTPEQIEEWVIQSNISAGEWDWDMLANEWDDTQLEEWGVDVPTDWGNETEIEEDEIPTPPKTLVTKPGDIWLLGNHRVICGDATDKKTVEQLMQKTKCDLTFTSPPYNVGETIRGGMYTNDDDDKTDDEYIQLLNQSCTLAIEHSTYVFWNIQMLTNNRRSITQFQHDQIDYLKDILIWNKQIAPPNINPGAFNTKWEYLICFSKDNRTRQFPCKWQGKYFNVIETQSNSNNQYADEHKAGFPVSFPSWIIQKMDFAKTVYDPFIGTGTTLIACEQTNRICYGIDIDPSYVDVTCKRYQKLTGELPILESTGEAHDFIG